MLSEFPGAQDKWYAEMAEIIPLLTHLQPPTRINEMFYCRFSPYHNDQEKFGLNLVPVPSYAYIYPMSAEDMANFAYFFIDLNEVGSKQRHSEGMQQLRANYAAWLTAWTNDVNGERAKLSMTIDEEAITITDTRPCAIKQQITLSGLAKDIYLICDTATSLPNIIDALTEKHRLDISPMQIELELDTLVKLKIMLMIDGRYLSLAVQEHNDLAYAPYPGGNIDKAKIHLKFLFDRLTNRAA